MVARKYFHLIVAVIIMGVPVFIYFNEDIDSYSCDLVTDDSKKIDCYINMLQECSGDNLTYYLLGDLFFYKGDDESALKYMNKYIKKNTKNFDAYALLGMINRELDNSEEALKNINTAINLGLDDIDIYLLRGEVLFELGEYEKSIEDFTKDLENIPSAESYILRGDAFQKLGEYQEAVSDYQSAIKLYREYPIDEYEYPVPGDSLSVREINLYIKQMEVLHDANLYDSFIETYNEAVKRNSDSKVLKEEFERLRDSFHK